MKSGLKLTAAIMAVTCISGAAIAELTKSKADSSDFGSVECKVLLNIEAIKGSDSVSDILAKTGEALDGICAVGKESDGHHQVAYADTKGNKLRASGYILRLKTYPSKPDKMKVALKGRWNDPEEVEVLKGGGVSPSKLEWDISGDQQINSVSYKLKLKKRDDFKNGVITGKGLMKAVTKRYPELGAYLKSIIGESKVEVPGYADHYGTWASIKPGVLPSLPDTALNLEVDILKLGQEKVIVELSFKKSASDKEEALKLHKEFGAVLKAKGLVLDTQATKTASYKKHFSKTSAPEEKKPAATTGATRYKK